MQFTSVYLPQFHQCFDFRGYINKLDVCVTCLKRKPSVIRQYAHNKLPIIPWMPGIPYGKYDFGLIASFGKKIPKNVIKAFPL